MLWFFLGLIVGWWLHGAAIVGAFIYWVINRNETNPKM